MREMYHYNSQIWRSTKCFLKMVLSTIADAAIVSISSFCGKEPGFQVKCATTKKQSVYIKNENTLVINK